MEVDAAPPPQDCLEPLDGLREADDTCLSWRLAAPLPAALARAESGVVAGPDGRPRVVVMGGADRGAPGQPGLASTWIYDPAEDRWSQGPALNEARWGHAVAAVGGELIVAGGTAGLDGDGIGVGLTTAERFGWDDGWRRLPGRLQPGRYHGAVVTLGRRALLIAGRVVSADPPSAAIDGLTPEGVINGFGALRHGRVGAGAARLPDDTVLVVGGNNPTPELGGDGVGFSALEGELGHPFSGISALSDGVLILGGLITGGRGLASAEVWRCDAYLRRFIELPAMAVEHGLLTVSAIGPTGGDWRIAVGGAASGIVQLYDPEGDRVRAYRLPPPFDRPLRLHTAAAFEVGGEMQVLVAGGEPSAAGVEPPLAEALIFTLTLADPGPKPLTGGCLERPRAPMRVRRASAPTGRNEGAP